MAALPVWKKILFRALPTLLVLALPVVGEMVLRATGQGIDTHPFLPAPNAAEMRRDNLDFAFKYHPVSRKSRQNIYKNYFALEKKAGALRGVVLGGSTAEGFPYNSRHGFSGILEESLAAATGRRVEVLNLGFSAMSSYYVCDVARKVADLDLDFAVIYTGHNEYYGTISYSSGSSHLAKLVNMRLKDFRLAQAVSNMMVPDREEGGPNLMTRQYAQTRFLPDEERDRQVRQRFLDNLDKTVALLAGRGVKVFVVEPVSNLIDMPPFVGGDDPGLDEALVRSGREVLAQGAAGQLAAREWLANGDFVQKAQSDPLAAYAQAQALLKTGAYDPARFTLARDLDPAPFRAPTHLVEALADWAASEPRVTYVALTEPLIRERGPQALSDELFIDHLHLNHDGQILTAAAIAQAAKVAMPEAGIDGTKLERWFADRNGVDESIGFLGVFDLLASRRVAALVAGPPYAGMAYPYRSPGSATGLDQDLLKDADLRRSLRQVPEGDMLMVYGGHLLKRRDSKAMRRMLVAFGGINPGSVNTHMAAGNYLATQRRVETDRRALEAYANALQLTEDPARQKGVIKSYLIGAGRGDLARRIP